MMSALNSSHAVAFVAVTIEAVGFDLEADSTKFKCFHIYLQVFNLLFFEILKNKILFLLLKTF